MEYNFQFKSNMLDVIDTEKNRCLAVDYILYNSDLFKDIKDDTFIDCAFQTLTGYTLSELFEFDEIDIKRIVLVEYLANRIDDFTTNNNHDKFAEYVHNLYYDAAANLLCTINCDINSALNLTDIEIYNGLVEFYDEDLFKVTPKTIKIIVDYTIDENSNCVDIFQYLPKLTNGSIEHICRSTYNKIETITEIKNTKYNADNLKKDLDDCVNKFVKDNNVVLTNYSIEII